MGGTGRDGLLADEDEEGLFALLPEDGLLCVFVPVPEGRPEEGRLCALEELPEETLLCSADELPDEGRDDADEGLLVSPEEVLLSEGLDETAGLWETVLSALSASGRLV